MSAEQEPRELTLVQKFWNSAPNSGFKNYAPAVTKVDEVPIAPPEVVVDPAEMEALEVEEALTPAPKASDVLEPADSSGSTSPTAPPESETPALPVSTTQQESSTDADEESGKVKEESAPVPPIPKPPSPSPVPFMPSSSSPPMPSGVSEQPASAPPQTSE